MTVVMYILLLLHDYVHSLVHIIQCVNLYNVRINRDVYV